MTTPEDTVFVKKELQRLVDRIREKTGIDPKIFLLRGNHDGTAERNADGFVEHPLAQYLVPFGDAILRGSTEFFDVGSIRIVGISYDTYIETRYKEVKPMVLQSFSGHPKQNILIVHNFINGYHNLPPGTPDHNTYTLDDFADLPVQLVITGHYHSKFAPMKTKDKIFLSCCATEARDLGDEGEHGVWILDDAIAPRFVALHPLHHIKSVEVGKDDATKPSEWFVENALEAAKSYVNLLKQEASHGIIRIILLGRTDGEPYEIEQTLEGRLAEITRENQQLVYCGIENKVRKTHETVMLPAVPTGGASYAAKILEPLGDQQPEGMKLVEEIRLTLEDKASEKTHQLTASDRQPFVAKWVKMLEKTEVEPQ
jgi:DNA repair exonuclease SbcCD nuclease subunit